MSKITIPSAEIKTDGSLFSWYYDNCISRSDVITTNDGTTVTAEGDFNISWDEIKAILDAGGETEGVLMAIRANKLLLGVNVDSDLPDYQGLDSDLNLVTKKYKDWITTHAEKWRDDGLTEIIFYTNPFAGNSDKYLKGGEIETIRSLSPSHISVITISEAQTVVASGWEKV